ncbi:hypothetical protein BOSE62_110212 [Bosea sp. 62]|nr:hypothetical protein BOSE21B_50388 [Bosea sp. 21B]CAD5289415.1 hypothetical protein BOSE46_70369 [Bosea sp. 46]CAD5301174.1 hypothetical protein BOSE7B_90306 [Bosea sp. 7B]VVT60514.1 hypothetical protein BOS5A_211305 [Bosea sp. EC-HK365B]VXB03134.1 hypothetical protein BOSE62_110212 [Bosea sp. 62]VXB64579.1 hypothetical protein BOSE127_140246 [Bosea sp. 127]VXC61303.1 hypothetical protein BOSE29B_50369 [Bosea sp. 29B]VXC93184.1 hypothetical protein BOSE125_70433 [Bosea sp. 125]
MPRKTQVESPKLSSLPLMLVN